MSPANAQTLVLNPGQTLSDQAPPLDGLRVILEADTGVGKTHYILHTIAAQTPLVLLLPTVNQVQQLAATYTQPADYVYGQSHPETLGPLIIATYDQADWITQQLGPRCEDYALVIDEIHQLYQAGSYRACALMKLYALIDHLGTPGQFRQLIGLSATPNPDLFYFEADRWWRIDRTTSPERTFHLVEYHDPTLWLDWLTHERATVLNPAQLHMIRLNNVADLDTLEAYFSQLGYRVLTVHSRVQDTEAVQEMLASQEVNDKYNLLLTTSLIDEGINLMNTDVGSIHSIGTTTHLSEIRQCLGRFRRANPTVYLHLPTLTTDPVPTLDLIAEGNALVETCLEFIMPKTPLATPLESLTPIREHSIPKLGERAIGHLVYQIAVGESGAVYLAVTGNGGSGYFSREWVALSRIREVLKPYQESGQTFPTPILRPAYVNRSNNNGGFLAAILRHEGLLTAAPDQPHLHCTAGDWAAWEAEQQQQAANGTRLEATTPTPTKPLARRRRTEKSTPTAHA